MTYGVPNLIGRKNCESARGRLAQTNSIGWSGKWERHAVAIRVPSLSNRIRSYLPDGNQLEKGINVLSEVIAEDSDVSLSRLALPLQYLGSKRPIPQQPPQVRFAHTALPHESL